MRLIVLLVVCGALGSCFFYTFGEGAACDPTLSSRDCREGPEAVDGGTLECVYSYDECPQYGCPRCRRTCRADADCVTGSTCRNPQCIRDTNSTFQDKGVCNICKDEPYYGPP